MDEHTKIGIQLFLIAIWIFPLIMFAACALYIFIFS
jgi:hypothetical protein